MAVAAGDFGYAVATIHRLQDFHARRLKGKTVTARFLSRSACVLSLAASLLAPSPSCGADGTASERWVNLFNGQNLEGWTPKITGHAFGENFANTFRVEDGLLKVSYDGYQNFDGQFGHLFYKAPFSKYRLKVEYRFVGEQVAGGPGWAVRNSGVMFHCEDPKGMRQDQEFPVSVEAQFLGGDGKAMRTTGNVCTPGTHIVIDDMLVTRHCTSSHSKTYHGDQWVTMELQVNGDGVVRHVIDGETVLEYSRPQLDPSDADGKRLLENGSERSLRSGYIALQAESHPVEFRKIQILDLSAEEEGVAAGGGWTDLLAEGLSKHWTTAGNWSLNENGVATLVPRPGEKGWQRYDAYLWSKEKYDDFEIDFEYRVEKAGNSGFYFNVGDVADPVAKGIEVQIHDAPVSADAKRTDHDSGGVIPGIAPAKATAKPAGEWNRFRITVKGHQLTVRLNGETVNEVDLAAHPRLKDRPVSGFIGFQDHGLPLALRNIQVRRLDAAHDEAK